MVELIFHLQCLAIERMVWSDEVVYEGATQLG